MLDTDEPSWSAFIAGHGDDALVDWCGGVSYSLVASFVPLVVTGYLIFIKAYVDFKVR